MAAINVNGHTVHAESQQEGGHQYSSDASASNYILLQCSNFPSNEHLQQLEASKVKTLEKVGKHTYLCHYEPADLEVIRALHFVTYANVFHQDLVAHKALADGFARPERRMIPQAIAPSEAAAPSSPVPSELASADDKMISVNVTLHPDSSMSPSNLKAHLSNVLGIEPNEINEDVGSVMLDIKAEHIDQIAQLDDVRRIRELPHYGLHNYTARRDLKPGTPVAGRRVEARRRLYDGEGEVVAVADSGFDRGIIADNDITRMHAAFNGRMVKLANYNYPAVGGRASANPAYDTHGHGTHVCGSVVGTFTSTDTNHDTEPIKGTAPKARLFVHACDFTTFTKTWNYQTLLNNPYDDNDVKARIFSNSWGEEPLRDVIKDQYDYNDPATKADDIVNTKPDLIALWSAGNNGLRSPVRIQKVGGIASAKNILTVGACFSSHPQTRFAYDPNGTDGMPTAIADFSSYGPTKEGRIKPDVIAPGTCILSARTQKEIPPDWNDPKDVPFVKGNINAAGATTDTQALFSTGTSMSTPLVAGCVAVIRAVFRRYRSFDPPASLLKALVVNGAVDLTTEGPFTTGRNPVRMPSNFQGFGRVSLERSLLNITDTVHSGIWTLSESKGPIRLGEKSTKPFNVPAPSAGRQIKLSVSMAYTDAPGPTLQNVVSLRVESVPGGEVKYGNTMNTNPDESNNVQKVVWPKIPAGAYKIIVHCHDTAVGVVRVACNVVWYWEEIPL